MTALGLIKTETREFSFGTFEIRELSAEGQLQLLEIKESPTRRFEALFICCKYGCWTGHTVEELRQELTLTKAEEVANAVLELSGLAGSEEAKKSEPVLSVSSSSG